MSYEFKDNAPATVPDTPPATTGTKSTGEPTVIEQLADIQKKFQDNVDKKLDEIKKNGVVSGETEATIQKMNTDIVELQKRAKRPAISSEDKKNIENLTESKELKQWESLVMKGEPAQVTMDEDQVTACKSLGVYNIDRKAAQIVSDNTYGGYLVPPQVAKEMIKLLYTYSDFRKYANVKVSAVPEWPILVQKTKLSGTWVGETETRDSNSAIQFGKFTIRAHEMYCMPMESNIIISDASFNLTSFLMESVKEAFGEAENTAFISGDSDSAPSGILKNTDIAIVKSGSSTALTTNGLIDLVYALDKRYRKGAAFMMNSKSMADIRQLKNATTNGYLWQPSLQMGEPERLLGYPIIEDENMPDVAGAAYPVTFGNYKKGYYILTNPRIAVLADPYTTKGYTKFYCTIRIGGRVADPKAIRIHSIAT